MATYAIQSHTIVFEHDDYTQFKVKQGNTTVATWVLNSDTHVKISISTGNYVVVNEDPGGVYDQSLNLDNLLQSAAVTSGGFSIGISDIRDMDRALLNYFLDVCPIWLSYENQNAFHVKSPCNTGCTCPATGCRSVTELP